MNDDKQRLEALDINDSYIVQAPAGSGKTELLTKRYLTLLAHVKQPEEVLALTFTNKAVDELFARIINALKSTQSVVPKTAHARHTFQLAQQVMNHSEKMHWQLLEQPERLKVMTWDGLCAQIMRRKHHSLTRQSTIKTDWQMEQIYQQAIANTIALIDDKPYQQSVKNVLAYFDNDVDKLSQQIMVMLKKRDQWLRPISRGKTLNQQAMNQTLNNIAGVRMATLTVMFADVFTDQFITAIRSVYAHLGSAEHLDYWQLLSKVCLTAKGQWRKTLTVRDGFGAERKSEKTIVLETIANVGSNRALLANLLVEIAKLPHQYDEDDWRILQDITAVLKLAVAQLNVLFDEQLTADYIDTSIKAMTALGIENPSDLALFLDYKLNHILIDEFQDTSYTHYQLLNKLIAGWQAEEDKSLFLVGDPMQSIYGFREAQVGVFLRVREQGIGNILPKSLSLSANFRSTQALVNGNNALFNQIFPTDYDENLGKVPFMVSQASDTRVDNDAFSLNLFTDDELDGQQIQHVISTIKTLTTQYPEDSIAVLVRARSHLQQLVTLLIAQDINFEATKVQKLTQHWLVRDLLCLSSVMVNGNDKLAWLSLLRSPWCGLLLADLLIIGEYQEGVWQALNDEVLIATLSQDGQQRCCHLIAVLLPMSARRGYFDLSYLVSIATKRLSVDDYLTTTELTIKRLFIEQLMLVEHQDNFSIELLKIALNELYVPSAVANVKLMTIHQAKGLEFDHVILAKLSASTRANHSEMVLYVENTDGGFIAAPSKENTEQEQSLTYQYIAHINKQKVAFEAMRLLYVAMTRAKKSMHLFAKVKAGKGDEDNDYVANKNTFLNLLLVPYQQLALPFFVHQGSAVKSDEVKPNEINTAPIFKRIKNLTAPLMPSQTVPVDWQQNNAPNANFDEGNQCAKKLGILTHRYLQHQHHPSPQQIKNDLLALAIVDDIEDKAQFITLMLNNAATDEKGQWIFQQRTSTQTEQTFAYVAQETIREVVIDCFFIENEVLWIIDFKTSNVNPNETIAQFSERMKIHHQAQLAIYVDVLAPIYKLPINTALYCPAVPIFIELVPNQFTVC